MSPEPKTRSAWLDLLRGLAISFVLLSHGRHFVVSDWDPAAAFRLGGFWGVELFFALSGFLIGSMVLSEIDAAARPLRWVPVFLWRRWLRTLPLYWLLLAVNLLLVALAVLRAPPPSLPAYLLFVQNFAWPHPDFMGEAWSLAVEEWFYLLFPLSLAAAAAVFGRQRWPLLVFALVVLSVAAVARHAAIEGGATWDAGIRKVVLCRLDAPLFGVLAAAALRWWPAAVRRAAPALWAFGGSALAVSAGVTLLGAASLDRSVFARQFLFPLTDAGFAAVLLAGYAGGLRVSGAVAVAARWVARWSYAAYLTNLPVFFVLGSVGLGPNGAGGLAGGVGKALLFVGATLGLSAMLYTLFERPILGWRDRRWPDPGADRWRVAVD
ncbi:MAG: acyltransferase family protein [Betaproteobacteria bacterium]